MKLDIVCVVWGASYTRLLLEFALPSLLAKGNLPDWPYCPETILQIYTSESDAAVIRQHSIFQAVYQYVSIDIHTPFSTHQTLNHQGIFNRLNQGHHQGILNARLRQAAFMYIAPDHVFSTGCMVTINTFLQSGVELIMALTPRVDTACQQKLQPLRQGDVLTLIPNIAADLFMQYTAPIAQAHFWDADVFNAWCSQVYCYTDSNQVGAQGFHLHPLLMCNPPPYEPDLQSTLDGDYLEYFASQRDSIRMAEGNELFILSLTPPTNTAISNSQFEGNFSLNYRQLLLDRFYRTFTTPIHRWFFRHRFILTGTHSTGTPDPACQKAIDAMQAFWDLDSAWESEHCLQVLELYDQHQALWQYLPQILQQGCQEYLKNARYSLLQ